MADVTAGKRPLSVRVTGGHRGQLAPYADAGCRSFNLIAVADGEQAAIEGADAVRAALRGVPGG